MHQEELTSPGSGRRRRDSKAGFHSHSPKTHPKAYGQAARSPGIPTNKLLGSIVQEEATVPLSPKKVRTDVNRPVPESEQTRDKVPQRQRPESAEEDPTDLKQKLKKMERRELALVKEGSPTEGNVASPRKQGKVTSPRSRRLRENKIKERPRNYFMHASNAGAPTSGAPTGLNPSKGLNSSSGNVWTAKSEAHELTKKEMEDLSASLLDLVTLPGNEVCADCNRKKPSWCSLSFGVLLCVKCSSVHRSFGNQHIIRSLVLDTWHDDDVVRVKKHGGNKKVNSLREAFLDHAKKPTWDSPEEDRKNWIRKKYDNSKALSPLAPPFVQRGPSSSLSASTPPPTIDSTSASSIPTGSPPSTSILSSSPPPTVIGYLNVNLLGARNLSLPEGRGTLNAYCSFRVGNREEIKSTIVKHSLSPYWAELLKVPIVNKKEVLHIVVKNWTEKQTNRTGESVNKISESASFGSTPLSPTTPHNGEQVYGGATSPTYSHNNNNVRGKESGTLPNFPNYHNNPPHPQPSPSSSSHHDFLGSATISLEELIVESVKERERENQNNPSPKSDLWVRLENVKHGLLHLELTFNPSNNNNNNNNSNPNSPPPSHQPHHDHNNNSQHQHQHQDQQQQHLHQHEDGRVNGNTSVQ